MDTLECAFYKRMRILDRSGEFASNIENLWVQSLRTNLPQHEHLTRLYNTIDLLYKLHFRHVLSHTDQIQFETCKYTRVKESKFSCVNCPDEEMEQDYVNTYVCRKCGHVYYIPGLKSYVSTYTDTVRVNNKTFRHKHEWLVRILGNEPEAEISTPEDPSGETLIMQVTATLQKKNVLLKLATIKDVRAALSDLGRTALNNNAAQILRRVTGRGPPLISDQIIGRLNFLFPRIIQIKSTTKMRKNKSYYPFIIARLLNILLDDHDYDNRRVFFYIHHQSAETTETNEAEWYLKCQIFPHLLFYKPYDPRIGEYCQFRDLFL